MADHESTMKWKVDVSQLKSAMQDAKRSISLANAEFKTATAGARNWANSITGVEAKLKQLNSSVKQQKVILKNLEDQYKLTADNMGENSAAAQRLKIQIENQRATIARTEADINKYTDKLGDLKGEEEKSNSAFSKLTSTVDEQQAKVDELKNKYASAVLQFGKNSTEAKKLASELNALSSDLSRNKSELQNASSAADKLDNSLAEVGDSAESISGGFTVLKGALANLVSQGISRAVDGFKELAQSTFEAGTNFESGMAKVSAVSGATGDELDLLSDKAKQMGETTVFSATDATDAMNYMAMAGWKTSDMLNGIEGVMNLAAASGADLATTSDIVTDALTAMGYSAGDAGKLADVMAAASSNANTNVEMMGQTFQYAAPIIGALGYNMQDTAVAIGLMANAGIKGEKAGTALRSILTRLSSPPKDCATAMEALGVSLTDSNGKMKSLDEVMGDLRKAFSNLSETQQTQYAKQIAGQEAMSGLLAVVRAAPADYEKLTDAVNNSSGAASKMAETMTDNVSGQITLLKSKVEGIMIKVFENASSSIRKAIDSISTALDQVDWNSVASGVGKIAEAAANLFSFILKNGNAAIAILEGIATAFITYQTVSTISTVITAFRGLVTAIEAGETAMAAFGAATAMNPIGLAVAAVAALTVGVVKYAKAAEEAKDKEWELSDAQQDALDKASEMADEYDQLNDARNKSMAGVTSEYSYIDQLKNEYNSLIDSNGNVKKGYEDRANFILSTLAEAMGMEVGQIQELIDSNGKLGESIDQVILKKQAEATLEANEDAYNAAIKNRTTALQELQAAQSAADEQQQKFSSTQEEYSAVLDHYNELLTKSPVLADLYLSSQHDLIESYETGKAKLDETNQEVAKAEEAWTGYNSTIQNYEGLSSAIISGDVDNINSALANLQNGFITAETGNREALEQQVADYEQNLANLQSAIQNGTPNVTQDMVDQAQSMVAAAKGELSKLPPDASAKGSQAGSNFASGVGGKSGEAKIAGSKIGSSAKGGMDSGAAASKSSGSKAGSNFASGVGGKSGEANRQGSSLGSSAAKGAASKSGEAKTSGNNFGQGFVNGIGSFFSAAFSKAKQLAERALAGLKSGQKEGSPSKLTRRSGVFFGQGYNLGIQDMLKPVTKSARNLATASVDAMADELQIHSPSKVTRNRIGKNMALGVSEGIKANEKEVVKAFTAMQNDVLSAIAASDRNADFSKIGTDTAKTFSTGITNSLKASKDATKKSVDTYFNDLINAAQKAQDKLQKKYNNTSNKSAKKRAKKQLERAKSETKQLKNLYSKFGKEVLTQYNKVIEEATKGVTDELQENIKNLTAEMDKAIGEINSKISSMQSNMRKFGDLYTKTNSGRIVVNNIQAQIDALDAWNNKITELKNKGISRDLLDEIATMDIKEGSGYMDRLLSMSDADLQNYNSLYVKKLEMSTKMPESFYQDRIDEIKTNYTDKIQSEFASAQAKIKDIGKKTMEGFILGMKSTKFEKNIKKIVKDVINSMKDELGIASPSKVFAELGMFSGQGFTVGLADELKNVSDVMANAIPSPDAVGFSTAAALNNVNASRTITFNQYNNSPKALDRLSIYRQTNNLLFTAKVVNGNV